MKKIFNSINIACLILVGTALQGQSLQEMIQIALESNYQIAISKNEAAIAGNNNVLGNSGALPSVELTGSYTDSYNTTKQQFADGTLREGTNAENTNINVGALANWTVFGGFNVAARKDKLDYLEQLGEINSKFYIEQTVSDLVTTYHEILYEQGLLDSFKKSLSISRYRNELEDKRKNLGSSTVMDYGKARVDHYADSILYLQQEYHVAALKLELNRIMGRSLEQDIDLSTRPAAAEALPDKESIIELVNTNNAQLDRSRLEELISETDLRMAKAQRYPQIDLFGGYSYTKTTAEVGFVNSNENRGPTFGLSVSFNLFNGRAANRAIKNSALALDISGLDRAQTDQVVESDVLSMYIEQLSMQQRLDLAQMNVEMMTAVFKAAEEQLNRGAINGYDFRLIQLDLLNAELSVEQMQFGLKAIEVNLHRMMGNVLESYL